MVQLVAMRAIQSSILSPTSESAHRRASFKLKQPTSFAYKVMAFEDKQRGWSWKLFGNRRSEITAKRPLQTEVAPVSPEDSPKIEEQWKAIQQLDDPAVGLRKMDDFTISVLSTVKPDHAAISVFIIKYHR